MSSSQGLLLVGVGGQGVLTAARFLGQAALAAGLEARVGQLHGMAQRGGSLESTIVLGKGQTAFISPGEVDILVAMEPLEAARALPRITKRTLAIVNSTPLVPFSLTSNGKAFPEVEGLLSNLREHAGQVIVLDAAAIAREVGEEKTINIVLLGVLAELGRLPFDADHLEQSLGKFTSGARRASTLAAFHAGQNACNNLSPQGVTSGTQNAPQGQDQ
ncbi:MAG: indolepyruvate oxidoreductase subunit beta [Sulfitobacter sp.]|nr:indolepyruvate oxidoreductase subunit beta [Sulfitobacter sp.]